MKPNKNNFDIESQTTIINPDENHNKINKHHKFLGILVLIGLLLIGSFIGIKEYTSSKTLVNTNRVLLSEQNSGIIPWSHFKSAMVLSYTTPGITDCRPQGKVLGYAVQPPRGQQPTGYMTSLSHTMEPRTMETLCAVFEGEYEIEFITDIEGHLNYFETLVSKSNIIQFIPGPENIYTLDWKDPFKQSRNGYLVYGGDIGDRGIGDIRIGLALTNFHRRYPGNVFFIPGNRDINKLRLFKEINAEPEYFNEPKNFVGFTGIRQMENKRNGWDHCKYELWVENSKLCEKNDTDHCRLQWILHKTMGAGDPDAFESRRTELQKMYERETVTNSDVVTSFLQSVDPFWNTKPPHEYINHGNYLWYYLQNSKLVHQLDINIFTHSGYFDKISDGFNGKHMNELKVLFKDAIINYGADPLRFDYKSLHIQFYAGGFEEVQAYYNENLRRYFAKSTNKPENKAMGDKLQSELMTNIFRPNQIERIFYGHTPVGDTPNILRLKKPQSTQAYYLISGDTGRSGNHVSCDKYGEVRGGAYGNIQITKQNVQIDGYTAKSCVDDKKVQKGNNVYESKPYHITLGSIIKTPETDKDFYVGTVTPDGHLVKYVITDKGFPFQYVTQTADDGPPYGVYYYIEEIKPN